MQEEIIFTSYVLMLFSISLTVVLGANQFSSMTHVGFMVHQDSQVFLTIPGSAWSVSSHLGYIWFGFESNSADYVSTIFSGSEVGQTVGQMGPFHSHKGMLCLTCSQHVAVPKQVNDSRVAKSQSSALSSNFTSEKDLDHVLRIAMIRA